ncbi:MAG: glucose dehydrogenase, partial [Chloroflexota bacterium]
NIMEGTHCFDPENPDETPPDDACPSEGANGEPLHLPVIEYPHLDNQGDADVAGISVIGGYIYRGEALSDHQGNYIFGDWSQSFGEPAGQLLMATPAGDGELWDVQQLMGLESYVLGFGEDANGELYVLTTDNTGPTGTTGQVLRIVPTGDGQ